MLQQQLIQERQQYEAWRASLAQPQPQPPISSSGPVQVGGDVEIIKERSASTSTKRARPEDQVSVKAKRARSVSTSRRYMQCPNVYQCVSQSILNVLYTGTKKKNLVPYFSKMVDMKTF